MKMMMMKPIKRKSQWKKELKKLITIVATKKENTMLKECAQTATTEMVEQKNLGNVTIINYMLKGIAKTATLIFTIIKKELKLKKIIIQKLTVKKLMKQIINSNLKIIIILLLILIPPK